MQLASFEYRVECPQQSAAASSNLDGGMNSYRAQQLILQSYTQQCSKKKRPEWKKNLVTP